MKHSIRFAERTMASVRCACSCGWVAEVMTQEGNRQEKLNARVALHLRTAKSSDNQQETRK